MFIVYIINVRFDISDVASFAALQRELISVQKHADENIFHYFQKS